MATRKNQPVNNGPNYDNSKANKSHLKADRNLFISPVYVKRSSQENVQQNQKNQEEAQNPEQKETRGVKDVNFQKIFSRMHLNKESFTQTSKTILELARLERAANLGMGHESGGNLGRNSNKTYTKHHFLKDYEDLTRRCPIEEDGSRSRVQIVNHLQTNVQNGRDTDKSKAFGLEMGKKREVVHQESLPAPFCKGRRKRNQIQCYKTELPTFLGDAEHLHNKEKPEFSTKTTVAIAMADKQATNSFWPKRITSFHTLFHVQSNEMILNDGTTSNDHQRRISTIKEEEFSKSSNSDYPQSRHAPLANNFLAQKQLNKNASSHQFYHSAMNNGNNGLLLNSQPIKCQLMRNSKSRINGIFKSQSAIFSGKDDRVKSNTNFAQTSKRYKSSLDPTSNRQVYRPTQVVRHQRPRGRCQGASSMHGQSSCSAPLLEPQVKQGASASRRTFMSPTLSSEQKSLKAAVENMKTLVDHKLNNSTPRDHQATTTSVEIPFTSLNNFHVSITPRLVRSEDISKRDHLRSSVIDDDDYDDDTLDQQYQRPSCAAGHSPKFNQSASTIVGSCDSTTENNGLYATLMNVKSSDWNVALKGLAEVVETARASCNPATFLPFMTIVNQRLLELLKSPRSHVCRTACQLAGHLFEMMRDTRRPEFDDIVNTLLYKTADSNKFIRHDANLALDAMVTHLPTFHAIRSLCAKGPTHRNALVRCAAVRLLICAVVIAGPTSIMHSVNHEHSRRRVINNLLYFLEDKNVDIRRYAERLYTILAKESTFDHYLKKYLDKTKIDALMRLLKFANKNPF